jgi:ribose-phosphate pyrophosphokinase
VVDKRRLSANETRAAHLLGAGVEGKTVVVFDDMISTAGSLVNAVEVARLNGAKRIFACATHGLFSDPAADRLKECPVEQIAVTDSIPLAKDKGAKLPNLKVISVAPLLADAIRRIHGNESISDLFRDDGSAAQA